MMMTFYEALVKALVDGILTDDREEAIYLAQVAEGCVLFLSDEDAKKAFQEALNQVEEIMKCSTH
tara:strand:+ start:746 stop:940 length:195 start_codon:yes stop_codon:yes gene_type:complete